MNYYLGIDLGGTNIAAGVVDENYRLIEKVSIPTGGSRPFEEVVADMARAARMAAEKAGMREEEFSSLGVGTPSSENPKTGLVAHVNNMGWHNAPLRAELAKHTALPLYINNDADCAALGEVLGGAAREYENALMITLGTGVGGGVILNKRIFTGADKMGCEPGHTMLVMDGVRCTCGKKGCFESYGSATALIRQTKEAMAEHPESLIAALCSGDENRINGKTVFDAAKQGDRVALAVVDRYTSYLAAGIGSLVTLFRPQVVIMGGGISAQGAYLLDPLNEKMADTVFAAAEIGRPKAILAQLGNDAGIIGAAMLEKHAQ